MIFDIQLRVKGGVLGTGGGLSRVLCEPRQGVGLQYAVRTRNIKMSWIFEQKTSDFKMDSTTRGFLSNFHFSRFFPTELGRWRTLQLSNPYKNILNDILTVLVSVKIGHFRFLGLQNTLFIWSSSFIVNTDKIILSFSLEKFFHILMFILLWWFNIK